MEKKKALSPLKKATEWIKIIGAREHNLKNVDLEIPKNKLTVITGPSGSGKSSLALDVLYTEGKRRYMESLSSYARQFLGIAKKPEFDRIEGLCPAIAIEQKTVGHNPRSTVGTITEIYDYLRVLFARIGVPHCPDCSLPIKQESPENITQLIISEFAGQNIIIAAPLVNQKKGEFKQLLLQLYQQGYYRFAIDEQSYRFTSEGDINQLKLAKTYKHNIDLLIDKCEVSADEVARLQEDIEKSFKLANGLCKVIVGDKEHHYSSNRMCLNCASSFPELEPRFFSFNSPIGACAECNGLGIIHEWPWGKDDPESWKERYPDFFGSHAEKKTCRVCQGRRLNKHALAVTINKKTIYDISEFSIKDALAFFEKLRLTKTEQTIGETLIREIVSRLTFLNDVGLSYLSLNRSARTLSGGEGQRIRLATQIGSALSGVLYILDEPSIGLHQRDNDRLIKTLKTLRDQGNTVVVVEHDMDTMIQADYLVDMGPAAGILGGNVTAVGNPKELAKNDNSLTGSYLAGKRAIVIPPKRRRATNFLTLKHANKNNLKEVMAQFPLEVLCCVSGVSGSGKSTLVLDELVPVIQREFSGYARKARSTNNADELEGADNLDALVVIDQTPIGRTPRSNPATYLGIFDEIRKLFSQLPDSQARGYKVGRFSFNVTDGRCFECRGDGTITVSMQFLADVIMTCKTCKGQRYNTETLSIRYKGKNIADVLDMTAYEAVKFFAAHKHIAKRLQLLCDVGLDYLKLGQSSKTLSGGEAQRIKLVDELAKRGNRTLYILDEPTTGLHNSDIEKLLIVLNRLVDKGNSMVIIEHNIDVLKTADYIIDMGPEGGDEGGLIVAEGTPEVIAKNSISHTGRYLKMVLNNG
jgi:excinuclease ABC subunit A